MEVRSPRDPHPYRSLTKDLESNGLAINRADGLGDLLPRQRPVLSAAEGVARSSRVSRANPDVQIGEAADTGGVCSMAKTVSSASHSLAPRY